MLIEFLIALKSKINIPTKARLLYKILISLINLNESILANLKIIFNIKRMKVKTKMLKIKSFLFLLTNENKIITVVVSIDAEGTTKFQNQSPPPEIKFEESIIAKIPTN